MTEHCGWREVYWTKEGFQCVMYQLVMLNGDGFGVGRVEVDRTVTDIPFLFIEQFAKWPLHRQWTTRAIEGSAHG